LKLKNGLQFDGSAETGVTVIEIAMIAVAITKIVPSIGNMLQYTEHDNFVQKCYQFLIF
jgi:hypothetical protein